MGVLAHKPNISLAVPFRSASAVAAGNCLNRSVTGLTLFVGKKSRGLPIAGKFPNLRTVPLGEGGFEFGCFGGAGWARHKAAICTPVAQQPTRVAQAHFGKWAL